MAACRLWPCSLAASDTWSLSSAVLRAACNRLASSLAASNARTARCSSSLAFSKASSALRAFSSPPPGSTGSGGASPRSKSQPSSLSALAGEEAVAAVGTGASFSACSSAFSFSFKAACKRATSPCAALSAASAGGTSLTSSSKSKSQPLSPPAASGLAGAWAAALLSFPSASRRASISRAFCVSDSSSATLATCASFWACSKAACLSSASL
mmetsp:Transcript_115089/g.336569  ORF Transcript_115089/g.336569 Transcript_115089/m.336569 type:complete len:212 (-) Transcript_115089:304-939(-)